MSQEGLWLQESTTNHPTLVGIVPHLHTKTQPRTQDAQASTDSREGRDSNDSQKPALGTRKANAMTASGVECGWAGPKTAGGVGVPL